MAKISKRAKAIAARSSRDKPIRSAMRSSLSRTMRHREVRRVGRRRRSALGIDAKKSDQTVRGSVVLPAGTGKTVRVAVFAQGAKAEEAKAAGADIVGYGRPGREDQGGLLDFDVVIASPDAMRVVGSLGRSSARAG